MSGGLFAHRARVRRTRHTVVEFRQHRLYVEKHGFNGSPESIRLMMLRDQVGELVGMMREHREAVEIAAGLLKDENVGVAPIAADVLRHAVLAGVNVSSAEGGLREALGDRYAKRNAAAALALMYVRRGDVGSLEGLLKHGDPAVRDGAGEACVECPDTTPRA